MLALRTGIYIILGFLSLSAAYKISPIIVSDGIPEFLNVTTDPFVKIGNGYYNIESNIFKNWYEAYEACQEMGASLIHFESIEEWNLINNYLNDTGITSMYWTAGTSLADKNNHVWFSTGKPISLDIWLPGEPNNSGGDEFCDHMAKLPIGLNDLDCYKVRKYICKAQQPATASFLVW